MGNGSNGSIPSLRLHQLDAAITYTVRLVGLESMILKCLAEPLLSTAKLACPLGPSLEVLVQLRGFGAPTLRRDNAAIVQPVQDGIFGLKIFFSSITHHRRRV